MHRKLISFAGLFVAVLGLGASAQVADAQMYGGGQCCGQTGYSGYGYSGYGPSVGYGYGSMGGSGYGQMSGYGYGYGSARMVSYSSYAYPSSGGCGTMGCGSASYCGTSRWFGGGLFGFRRSGSCCDPCGYSGSGYSSYYGMGGYSGCGVRAIGFPRLNTCGYQPTGNACCLPSCTGSAAACCTPAPNTSSGPVQTGNGTTVPTPTPIPSPPVEPAPATAPTPAT